jgi:hypothetical protein
VKYFGGGRGWSKANQSSIIISAHHYVLKNTTVEGIVALPKPFTMRFS